jgi:hypothetical protein
MSKELVRSRSSGQEKTVGGGARPSQLSVEKLRSAALLVLEVLATLDSATERCKACGKLNPTDRTEHRAHEALTQIRLKLLDWADTLYLPPEDRDDSQAARRIRREGLR